MHPTLVWFRQDLRLQDQPALAEAHRMGKPVVPVYVDDEAGEGCWPAGKASRSWLKQSLAALDASLRERGSRLVKARGKAAEVLRTLAIETGAESVHWTRRYEPAARKQEAEVAKALREAGVASAAFDGGLLFDPDNVQNRQGGPYQVFTPFWRHCLTLPVAPPDNLGKGTLSAPRKWPRSLPIDALESRMGADAIDARWTPGEAGAWTRLRRFIRDSVSDYAEQRNRPAEDGTSMLSPHLHFGEISPRQVWAAVQAQSLESGVFPPSRGASVFLSEIGWREFGYHLLTHFPHTPEKPLREAFERFPWAIDRGGMRERAWREGQTGYPIVDAGMRQLLRMGWMHNRVRMIVASFLVKHLRLPWTRGSEWFWDRLVDADLASNTLGWQWSAGCGADAAPYFRIFAPVTQGKKFDPDGRYVRQWVPELAAMPAEYIHAPWMAPPSALLAAGVALGRTYPAPLVDHVQARTEALAAFRKMRQTE